MNVQIYRWKDLKTSIEEEKTSEWIKTILWHVIALSISYTLFKTFVIDFFSISEILT